MKLARHRDANPRDESANKQLLWRMLTPNRFAEKGFEVWKKERVILGSEADGGA